MATRNRLLGQAAFLNSLYACLQIVPIGSECSPLKISDGSEFQVTEKIFSAKQNQSIKESLTQTLMMWNIHRENRAIVLKPEQEMVIYSLLHRRDVMAILSTAWFWQKHDLYHRCYG